MPDPDGPSLAVSAVVRENGRLLMVQRANEPGRGTWALPGGLVRQRETLAEAIVREVREETGIDGFCGPLIGLNEVIPANPGDRHLVIAAFEVDLLETARPAPASDAADARWVPLGDVAELLLAPGLAEFLHDHEIIETIV